MTHRRDFVLGAAGALGALSLAPAQALARQLSAERDLRDWIDADLVARGPAATPEQLADDERFWGRVRRAYAPNPNVVNLDHGWANPAPRTAVDDLVREARALEAIPAERLEHLFFEFRGKSLRPALAAVAGAPAAEVAVVRNATEALDTVILGVPLQAGDEIVCSAHDYFAMLDALEQRQRPDGVVLRMIRPPLRAPSFDALAEPYEAAIGPRTKLVLLTHPSNLTGQLLPVRRIAAAAHRAGAEVVVDGAQSLGVLDEPITAFDCDYYDASAHKWLGAPVGVGMLWMRPAHAAKVWPLVPAPPSVTGMERFEWPGTAPDYVKPGVISSLALHRSLGAARKAARLRYLTAHWRTRAAAALPQTHFYTADIPAMSIGLCTIELPDVDADALQKQLRRRHRVLVQSMAGNLRAPEIRGIRVTPNVYTTPAELDRFVRALVSAARELGTG